jgi:predicted DCC family thiol-disulfide oxidoreductase YuxK
MGWEEICGFGAHMQATTTVIYNDTCPICAREVAGYKRMAAREDLPIAFSGLSEGDHARHGLTEESAARRFHVLQDGQLVGGVDAFVLLWSQMPRLRWLARLVGAPVIRPLACMVYDRVLAPALYTFHRRRVRKGTACRIA